MTRRSPRAASLSRSLVTRLRRVRALVLDFDGVLTDNTVFVHEDGSESVRCWRSDGIGLAAVRRIGLSVFILSTEVNHVVRARARKLNVPLLQGYEDKGRCLDVLLTEQGLPLLDPIEQLFPATRNAQKIRFHPTPLSARREYLW